MDEILLNPGYHDVSKRILTNLNDHSLVILSQTIKGISKLCEPILIKRGQKRLEENEKSFKIFRFCPEKYLIRFMKRKQILHEGYFKFPFCETKDRNEMNKVLEEFLKKLAKIKDWLSLRTSNWIETTQIIQLEYKLQEYVDFIPGHCPSNSKKHVLNLLTYAMKIKSVKMAKSLLTSIKDDNSCVMSMNISIFSFYTYSTRYDLLPVFKKIASECKNPNVPNTFGTTPLHDAVKLGEFWIVKVLLDIGDNLEAVNQYGKDALQIAEDNGHKEIVKLIKRHLQR